MTITTPRDDTLPEQERELVTRLIGAAHLSDWPLTQQEVDTLLGIASPSPFVNGI